MSGQDGIRTAPTTPAQASEADVDHRDRQGMSSEFKRAGLGQRITLPKYPTNCGRTAPPVEAGA